MQKVIDISKWQGNIDYDKVKKSGKVDGVIIRSSIGVSTDDKFYEYVNGFQSVSIPIIGVYHFSHATNISDVQKEAALIISNTEKAGLPKTTIIFFDFEYESLDNLKNKVSGLSNTELKKVINGLASKFCSMVESAGYKAGIYFNPDFATNWFETSTLDGHTKWLADWRGSKGMACDIWQYGTITVDGITNQVDGNECYLEFTSVTPAPAKNKKSNEEVADDVIKGLYGVGNDRKKKLESEGYNYKDVQSIVNKKMAALNSKPKKSNEEVADDVIKGLYGVGNDRKKRLEAEGYVYKDVQDIVNKKTNGTFQKVSPAKSRDTSLSGTYIVTAEALNVRFIPGVLSYNNVITVIKKGQKVHNYGYYTIVDGKKWLYVQVGSYAGHIDSTFVTKS